MRTDIQFQNNRISGSKKEVVDGAVSFINGKNISNEAELRKELMPYVDTLARKDWLMVDGNSVYSQKRVLSDFNKFIKGISAEKLSDYLYEFFTNRCGTIAHYDKMGG